MGNYKQLFVDKILSYTPFHPHHPTCVKSYTFRLANAATRSVPSSGKSSPTSTESTPPAHTMATPTFSWSASTFITMRPQEANTCPVQSSSIWSPARWIPSDLVLLDRSTDQTTLSLVRVVQVTTGLRDITQKVLSWLTLYSMSSAKSLKAVTVFRDSN